MKMFEMKMHSALYFPGSTEYSQNPDNYKSPENPKDSVDSTAEKEIVESEMVTQDTAEAVDDAVNQAKEGAESVKEDISSKLKKDAEAAAEDKTVGGIIPGSFNTLGNEIYKRHSSDYNVKEQTTIYSKRCAENEIYKKWDKNIQDGFSRLMNALLEHKYFDDLLGKNKAKSVDQIRDMYKDYLVKQYEKNVWNADDTQFNNIKDFLFAEGSDTDPARAIYEKLTGTSLKTTETERRNSYHIEADKEAVSERNIAINQIKEESDLNKKITMISEFLDKFELSYETLDQHIIGEYSGICLQVATDPNKLSDEGKHNLMELQKKLKKKKKEVKEQETTKSQVRFLSVDLPNYLWDLKGNGSATKIFKYIPLVDVKKFSDEDKKAIKNFVELANKYGDQRLFDLFENAKDNRTEQEWLSATQNFDPKVKDKSDLEAIMTAGKMYIKTQAVDVSLNNQHNIYLSVLQIIKDYGGCENAMNAFKGEIDKFNEHKLSGRERRYFDNGEALKAKCEEEKSDFYNVVFKINKLFDRKDFGNATRLFDKELSPELSNEDLVNILADLNNDGTVDTRDAGFAKTGNQFMEIVKQIGTKTALDNLRERAKLLNTQNNLGFNEEQLNGNSKEIIYFLQNIISNPKEDLYTLMTKGLAFTEKQNDTVKYLQERGIDSKDNPEFQEKVSEFLKNVDISHLSNIEGADMAASSEGLHQAVAAALYTEYTRGVGLGGRISFDEWIKGVSLNGGVQYGDGGVNVGLTLSYNRDINLGKGWSVTPGASFGFVPFVHFSGSAGVELAKKWVNDKGVQEKIGMKGSYTNIGGAVNIYSALVGWNQDKLAGLNERENELKGEFGERSKSLLDKISKKLGDNKLDLSSEDVCKQISEIFGEMDEVKNLKNEEKQKFIDNTIAFLNAYDGADLKSDAVKQMIAINMAERYAAARKESTKNSIDGKTYFSGVRAGVAFVQAGVWGAPVFHVGVSFSSHKYDGYGDVNYNTYKSEAPTEIKENSEWKQSMLDKFNNALHLSEGSKLTLKDGFVVIPTQCLDNVNVYVNENMEGKLAKDEKGNILMPATSVMSWPSIKAGTSSYSAEFVIGGGKKSDSIKLDKNGLPTDRFKDKSEIAAESKHELLNKVLNTLKEKFKDDQQLQHFEAEKLDSLNIKPGKVYKLVFEKSSEGKISVKAEEIQNPEGGQWQIEYKTEQKAEIMNKTAKEIAETVYGEAQKCKTNALYAISHSNINGLTSSYRSFANEIKNQNYDDAKTIIVGMLPKMDDFINKYEGKGTVNFSDVITKIDGLQGLDLGQALLSINNVFARVASVKGGENGEYSFRKYENNQEVAKNMGVIIEERAKQIGGKLNNSDLPQHIKSSYESLITASERYRNSNSDQYNDTHKKTNTLQNAVGINLGNAINAENLLFNPEVYEGMQSNLKELGLNDSSKQVLHKHALEEFVKNKALISPVLKSLGFQENAGVKVKLYENEQLTLDIDGKNVILNADLKFGYFAQCVNHMLILDNISATIPETGETVAFSNNVISNNGNGVDGGLISESTKATIMSTTTIDLDVAGKFLSKENGDINDAKTDDDDIYIGGSGKEDDSDQNAEKLNDDPTHTGDDL